MSAKILSLEHEEFKSAIRDLGYEKLNRMRGTLLKMESTGVVRKRLKEVETLMRKRIDDGQATRVRRKQGTGTLVEQELTYKDSPNNRRLNRVGQTYKRVRYEGAETEEYSVKMRKRKRISTRGESGRSGNNWIKAVQQARQELEVKGFVCIRSEPNNPESESDVLGSKVYHRAKEIHEKIKRESQPQEEAQQA